jgi:hypothetical protein
MTVMEQLVDVTAVEVIGDYQLRLSFADGTVGDVDFTGRDWQGVFEPLRDPAYFARVEADPKLGRSPGPTARRWPPNRSTPKPDATWSAPRAPRPDRKQQVSGSGVNTLAQGTVLLRHVAGAKAARPIIVVDRRVSVGMAVASRR